MPWQDYLTSLKYFFFSASVLHFLCTSEERSFSSSMMEVFAVDVLDGDGGPASTVAIAVAAASNSSAISMVTLGTLCSRSAPKPQMLGPAANSKVGGSNIILRVGAMELALSSTSTSNFCTSTSSLSSSSEEDGQKRQGSSLQSPCQPFYRCWWKNSEAGAYW